MPDVARAPTPTPEQRRIARLEQEVATLTGQLQDAEGVIARLRRAYTHALEQLELLRRRLFVAKAERRPHHADQLAFEAMFAEVQRLEQELETVDGAASADGNQGDADDAGHAGHADDKPTRTRKGRRDLADSALPEIRVEIPDPELEAIADRIGFEYAYRLGFERGGMRKIVLARVVYKVRATPPVSSASTPSEVPGATDAPAATLVVTPLPKELFRRCLLAPSMMAHILVAKYMMGVPFYRLEQKFALEGAALDRGTMCRYAEDVGATLGAIVEAMRDEAMATAFCLSTDATGVSLQLGPLKDRVRGPCRKAHFFVVLADRDHVFFEYQAQHTSAVVCAMFQGFTGYLQADAHAIYDALFGGTTPRGQPPDPTRGPPPIEVGCLAHARRYFWEAAVCKHALGVEGLRRIDAIFVADARLADLPPAQRKTRRDVHVRPHVDAFFAWVRLEQARPRERGLVATALGYALHQELPLRRFLEDGRLKPDNNGSERALRTIATGRKAWLFFGSDDHASAAANLFSLIASCKLHGLDPERYLADVIRVMPYWPRERYLELAPKYWARTRARLHATELAKPLGLVTVPEPLSAEEQPSPR